MTSAADIYFDPAVLRASTRTPPATTGPLVVAFQGELGAYSEQAMRQLFAGSGLDVQPLACPSFEATFRALRAGDDGVAPAAPGQVPRAQFVLVPIENSLGGSVHDNYDLLLRHRVTCVAEMQFKVEHCLLAQPGVRLEDLRAAYSHPQALAQCEGYLSRLNIAAEKQYDTAGSAKLVAAGGAALRHVAAVASEAAASTYGLQVLARNIEDEPGNYTRFLLLAPSTTRTTQATMYAKPLQDAASPTTGGGVAHLNVSGLLFSPRLTRTTFKTSLVFSLPDGPGALFKALSVFALRDIQLVKIESRPCKDANLMLEEPLSSFAETKRAGASASSESAPGAAEGSAATAASEFKYLFFVDASSSLSQSESLKNGLRHLREYAPFLRVLGSYPVFQLSSPSAAADQSLGMHERTSSSAIELASAGGVVPSAHARKLRIGILGFGTFGQFLARTFRVQGHEVIAHSRSDYTALATSMGVEWCSTQEAMCSARLDVLILAVSILSFADSVAAFPWEKLQDALVVDVLSVKEHPRSVLLTTLEKRGHPSLDYLATHPMFGPESGKHSWKGLALMFDRVRVAAAGAERCEAFLNVFEREGCRMLQMTCAVHDAHAAGSQFLTHTTGRILAQLGCTSTPINTAGYSKLLQVIEQTKGDSWDLYQGLYQFNQRSQEQLEKFASAFDQLRRKLHESVEEEKAPVAAAASSSGVALNPVVLRMNESKTVAMADRTKALASAGISVTSLAVGEVLSRGTPPEVIAAATAAMQAGHTTYTATAGMLELRQAICGKLQRENGLTYTPDQVVVSNGAKQSLYQALLALVTPDENEVIVPAPYWTSYPDMVTLVGGRPVIVDTAEDAYVLTPEKLARAITPRTKLLILCSPGNPTGVVYSRAQLEALAVVLRAHPRVHVLSDEIYEHLVYGGAEHVSFATLEGMASRTLTINGFSKAYVMTGFRVGYCAAPTEIARALVKIQGQLTSCSSSVSQCAAIAALKLPASFRVELVSGLERTRQLLLSELAQIPNIVLQPVPNGAFYALVDVRAYLGARTQAGVVIADTDALALHLLDAHRVALVAGSAFGAPSCLRISYASSDDIVRTGIQALKEGLAQLQR